MFNRGLFAMAITHWRGNRSLRDISDILGVSASTLSRLENNKLPDIETFALICELMNFDPAQFFRPTAIDERLKQLEADEAMRRDEYEQRKREIWSEVDFNMDDL